MSCQTFKFTGTGQCKQFLQDVKGLIIVEKNTTQTVAQAKTLAGWQALICPATTAAIKGTYLNIDRGFETKTPAPEMATSNTGYKEKTKDLPVEFTAYGLISYSDYQNWFAGDGKEFDFVPVLADGKLLTPLTSAGLQIGFCGRLYTTYDLPKAGAAEKQKAHEFNIFFDDVEQMKNLSVITPDFTRKELEAVVPVGINIDVVTPYNVADGTVVLKATKRGTGQPYAGFTTFAQWEVVELTTDAGGAATAITATSASLGLYTLTFLNSVAKLTGDFKIQAVTVAAPNITYLSNVLNVPI